MNFNCYFLCFCIGLYRTWLSFMLTFLYIFVHCIYIGVIRIFNCLPVTNLLGIVGVICMDLAEN